MKLGKVSDEKLIPSKYFGSIFNETNQFNCWTGHAFTVRHHTDMFERSFIASTKSTKYFTFIYFIVKHSASVYSLYCGMDKSPFSSLLKANGLT